MPRIDANVILRYLTDEPADQAARAARLFQRVAAGEVELAVDDIVVAEVVWTLASYYQMAKAEIVEAMLQLLPRDGIVCRDGDAILRALVLFEQKNIDFVDAVLCARMLDEGEPEILSFDRDFDRVEGITRVEP